jgi:dipeptidyl aminopeptidase/acylaminoacyl peptidase
MLRLPHGSWPSPISADLLVAGAAIPSDAWATEGRTWWSQSRPDEGGRIQITRRDPDGSTTDLLPDGANARTRAHEYGGGAWWVHSSTVFWVSWDDQRVYRSDPGAPPVPLTPGPVYRHGLRYADGRLTPDGRTVICVRESHPAPGSDNAEDVTAVRNEIVAFAAVSGEDHPEEPVVLVTGPDFVAAPRISPDGRRLAWLTWDHPDMPWDSTRLWVGDLEGIGSDTWVTGLIQIAGGDGESLVQPEWGADGTLYVVSDRSDWWNVYRVDDFGELTCVHPVASEVGSPAWVFGQSRYVIAADGTVWFTYALRGEAHLVSVSPDGAVLDEIVPGPDGQPLRELTSLSLDSARLVAVALQHRAEPVVLEYPLAGGHPGAATVLCPARDLGLDPAGVSVARAVEFPGTGGNTAHAMFYPPASAVATAPEGAPPPLIVTAHGGPHGSAYTGFRLATQFWTSRGFAVLDVDYAGSTGYGRAYRRLLDDAWGVLDVADVCAAAAWVAEQGLVDGKRMAIRGSSAGGLTTLMALATSNVFATGVSLYGVVDLTSLAADTHKFESRYLDRLIGPYPKAEQVYRERSPLSHVDDLDRPLLVLQGAEDTVVPPAQAEAIVAELRAKEIPHAYLLFPGEQHGFRRAETIVRAMTAELSFYAQVFGFTPADDIEPVELAFSEKLGLSAW